MQTQQEQAKRLRDKAWRLSELSADLEARYEESQGEETERVRTLEDLIAGEENTIPEAACWLLRELRAREQACKDEIERLQRVKAEVTDRTVWAKDLLLLLMRKRGLRKLDVGTFTISVLAGKQRVNITDIDALPEDLVKIELVPRKQDIKKRLQAHHDVPGATLGKGPESISVR